MSKVLKMTRKQALLYAIEHIGQDSPEAVEKLKSMYNDMPMCHWSKEACEDAIEQFYIDCGRYPNTSDLDRYTYLPSHPTVKNRFGVEAREFLAQYTGRALCLKKDAALEQFVAEFNRIQPTSSVVYNKEREEGVISWQFVAHLCGLHTWMELLNAAGVKRVVRSYAPKAYRVNTKGGVWEIDKRIAEIDKRIENS